MTDQSSPLTSSILAAVAWLISLSILVWHTELFIVTATATVAGVALVLSGLAGTREQVLATIAGSLLFVGAAGLLAAAFLLTALAINNGSDSVSPELYRISIYLLGCFCGAVGVTLIPRQSHIRTISRSLLATSGMTTLVVGVTFSLAPIGLSVLLGVITPVFTAVVTPEASPQAIASLILLAGTVVFVFAAVIVRLPISALVRRKRRQSVKTRLNRLYQRLLSLAVGSMIVGVLALLVLPPLWDAVPGTARDGLLAVSTFQLLRIVLIGIASVAALCIVLVAGLRTLHPESAGRAISLIAHGAGAIFSVAAVLVIGPELLLDLVLESPAGSAGGVTELVTTYRDALGSFGLVTGVIAGVYLLPAILVFAASGLGAVGVLSSRTAGSVIAAAGLTGAAVASGQYAGVSPLLFVVVALAFVVWDVATFGYSLGIELRKGSRRLELVHGGTVLLVGLLSTAVVYGLFVVTQRAIPRSSAGAAVAALFSILLVAIVIRS